MSSLLAAALLVPSVTLASGVPQQRFPYPTPLWIAAQLVPSPEVIVTGGEAAFGLRWQLTPVLFSFGVRRGLNRWRVLVAEPLVRYSGSVEVYVAPEYLALPGEPAQQWGLRTGVRAHLPLVERGENLALFVGASHFLYRSESSVGVELGANALWGLLGAQVTLTPRFLGEEAWIFTLRLRYL